MKQISGAIFFCLIVLSGFAQEVKRVEFIGTLELSGKVLITYKVDYKLFADGKIKGFSVSDIYGKNRTQSTITGTYDSIARVLSFKEEENVSTKANTETNDFCFISVSNAKIKSMHGKDVIQGKFSAKQLNGKVCDNGSIYLINSDGLKELANESLNSKKGKDQDSVVMVREKLNELAAKVNVNQLRGNEKLNLSSSASEIVIDAWDGGKEEDKDQISIWVNNVLVADKLEIVQEKKEIRALLTQETNTIKILAVSEGLWRPCTVNLMIHNGNEDIPVVATLKKGETTLIVLKKTQP